VSDVEIVHPVPVDEVRAWASTLAVTFLNDPQGDSFDRYIAARARDWATFRSWGARADGRWVATLGSWPLRLRIPAGAAGTREIVADGLTSVTVNATHRRRGLLTRMLAESLDEARQRGEAVSILVAAEWPIYGRFGYAPASRMSDYTFFPRSRDNLLAASGIGHVRQVDPAELGDIAPDVFERSRVARAGHIARDRSWWPAQLGLDGLQPVHHGKAPAYFVHEGPDGPDGLLWWSPVRDFDIDGTMGSAKVGDLSAANDNAYRNLWAYLAGIDVVSEITLTRRPIDEPIRWALSDGRALRNTYTGDDMWLRILDVPAALSARGYAREDRVVLDVADDDIGRYGSGRFVLDSGTGECTPTTASADLELTQRALASIYLGGFSLREQSLTGAVTELTPGALDRVDAIFSTVLPPWNATGF
jgi:predicted acetyltransferase